MSNRAALFFVAVARASLWLVRKLPTGLLSVLGIGCQRDNNEYSYVDHHRRLCEKIVSLAPTSKAYADQDRVVVGLDECLNDRVLWATLRVPVSLGRVFIVSPLWDELRKLQSGEEILGSGGNPTGYLHGFDLGRRVRVRS